MGRRRKTEKIVDKQTAAESRRNREMRARIAAIRLGWAAIRGKGKASKAKGKSQNFNKSLRPAKD